MTWVQGGDASAVWLLGDVWYCQMTLSGVTQGLVEEKLVCETASLRLSHCEYRQEKKGPEIPGGAGVQREPVESGIEAA